MEANFVTPISIKSALGSDLRRFLLQNLDYAELLNILATVHNLPKDVPVSITYRDNEGDLVTLSTAADLTEAVRQIKTTSGETVLRLQLSLQPVTKAADITTAMSEMTVQPGCHRDEHHFGHHRSHRGMHVGFGPRGAGCHGFGGYGGPLGMHGPHPHGPHGFGGPHGPHGFGGPHGAHSAFRFAEGDCKGRGFWKEMKKWKKEKKAWHKLKHAAKKDLKRHGKEAKKEKDGEFRVDDISQPDVATFVTVAPSTAFIKTWTLRNEGTQAWPADTQLFSKEKKVFGCRMQTVEVVHVGAVQPQQEVTISLPMSAPSYESVHFSVWRLQSVSLQRKLGKRLVARFIVRAAAAAESGATTSAGGIVTTDDFALAKTKMRELKQQVKAQKNEWKAARKERKHYGRCMKRQ